MRGRDCASSELEEGNRGGRERLVALELGLGGGLRHPSSWLLGPLGLRVGLGLAAWGL